MTGLPQGWALVPINAFARSRSGNSKLIKGQQAQEPAAGLFPAFSASGQDVWVPAPEHEGNAIIISAVGARCGKTFRASGRWSAVANTNIVWPEETAVDADWLQLLLNDENFWEKGGSAQPFVKVSATFEREIPLPPLPEQRRIVRKLDTLSARSTTARTHLTAIEKLVERYKSGVLGQIFANLDKPTDQLRNLTSLVTSGSRGWAKFYSDEGPLFIRVGDTRRGTPLLDLSDAQRVRPPAVGEGQRTKLRTGDIVVSITADLGRVGVVPPGVEEAYVNQHIALVRLNEAHNSQFIAWYLISPAGQAQLLENNRGATKAGLGLDDIRDVQIPRCTSDEQREIVRRIETAFAKIDRLAAEAAKALKLLGHLDGRILAKAFAGDLVPQDPNDEPAETLLARIREARASAPRGKRGRKAKA